MSAKNNKTIISLMLGISLSILSGQTMAADKVNAPNVPLETGAGSTVKSNLMFVLDDSGSMDWDYLGDGVNEDICKSVSASNETWVQKSKTSIQSWTGTNLTTNTNNCNTTKNAKTDAGTSADGFERISYTCENTSGKKVELFRKVEEKQYTYTTSNFNRLCAVQLYKGTYYEFKTANDDSVNNFNNYSSATSTGYTAPDVMYFIYQFNKMYYNPNVKYKAGVRFDGTSLGDQSITSAKRNIYLSSTQTANLTTDLKETYFCKKTNPSSAELADTNICRRNGKDTPNPFNYTTEGYPKNEYFNVVTGVSNPHYYNMIATDFCDITGKTCTSTSATGTSIPFPVRWCATAADAISTTVPTGTTTINGTTLVKCQEKKDSKHSYVRLGKLQRVDIDTASAEAGNYANWYTYYRNRLTAMKTATGLAFKDVNSGRRVGFTTINPTVNNVTNHSSKFLAIKDFDNTQKEAFFTKLYAQTTNGSTPLREALSRIGRYYAGKTDGINANMISTADPDPVQYSCQQNFTIMSTDGYWNGGAGVNLSGTQIKNTEDATDSGYSARTAGSYDGGLTDSKDSSGNLADVAMYYYKTDLRTTGTLAENNVPISALDKNQTQHMVTYAISLGLSGYLNYTKDYYKGTNADLESIKKGTTGACSWTTGKCNWPLASVNSDDATKLDDLWHATVNGRGRFFNAQNSEDIITGLNESLNASLMQVGASAASATSSPNITATDNKLFYATYRTAKWDGEITATTIDPQTGEISATPTWSAREKLETKTSASTDTRTIKYVGKSNKGAAVLKDFTYSNLSATEKAYFENKCSLLAQCTSGRLTEDNKTSINGGETVVNFLRGQKQHTGTLFREREYVLGDIVNSAPVYVKQARYKWADAGYDKFKEDTATRQEMVYVGANDGMLHAFNASTGVEEWAIIPNQMLNKMYKLTDDAYVTGHEFYVDGNLTVMDAKVGNAWKTVLVIGMGHGGNGYMAIDVTNPTSPTLLWEFCNNSTYCTVSDSELGKAHGNPIVTKRALDDKWVVYVTSGYDNTTGNGIIYELDVGTGEVLRKLGLSAADKTGITGTNQVGIAKINTLYEDFSLDNKTKTLYAGDLNGNIWKWDLSSNGTDAIAIGSAKDASGKAQPITTKIELGKLSDGNILFITTGKYLNQDDLGNTDVQSVYGIKDTNTSYGNLRNNSKIVEQTITGSGIKATSGNVKVDFTKDIGWYFDLKAVNGGGERVNVDSIFAVGVLSVISNVPATSLCTAGGTAWYYQVDYLSGGDLGGSNQNIAEKLVGGLAVGQVVVKLGETGAIKNLITDATGKVTPNAVKKNANIKSNTVGGDVKRVGWREIYKK